MSGSPENPNALPHVTPYAEVPVPWYQDRVRGEVEEETSLVSLLSIVLRYRWLVVACALLGAIAAATYLLTRDRTYTSSSSFVPQGTKRQANNLAGLAAQFGVNLTAGGDAVESPAFYTELLMTHELLEAVVDSAYTYTDANGRPVRVNLVDVLKAKGKTPAAKHEDAIDELRKHVNTSVGTKTGIVHLAVSAPNPLLAKAINDRLIAELNRFNLERRQSQAAAERAFTERRLNQVADELHAAEQRWQQFLESNRDFHNSKLLQFEHDRLSREANFKRDLYSSVQQAYEQAKIDQVRDTPVITVVDRSVMPVKPDPRGVAKTAFLAAIFGALVGMLIGVTRHVMRRSQVRHAAVFEEFSDLKRTAADELRHPIRNALTRSGRETGRNPDRPPSGKG